jgi:hypothetical protein
MQEEFLLSTVINIWLGECEPEFLLLANFRHISTWKI